MGTLGGRLAMDTSDTATKVACADVLQSGVRQSRYRLKKKFFDGVPANEVRTTSPVSNIIDEQWRDLVRRWSDPKKKEISEKNKENRAKVKLHQTTGSRSYVAHCYAVKEKYKDKEPDALDIFKECYNRTKKGFSEPVKQALADMEAMLVAPVEDGQRPRFSTDVVSKVLTQSSVTSTFLKNVGFESSSKNTSSRRRLHELLELEKQGPAVLQQTVESQQKEIETWKKQVQEADDARNKQQEEMEAFRKKQEASDAILQQLMILAKVQTPP